MPAPDGFAAIADPTRRLLLDRIREASDGLSARAVATGLPISQPAVSRHLKVLRQAGLVRVDRAGRERIYRLEQAAFIEIADWIGRYRSFWDDRLEALGHQLKEDDRR